VLIFLDYDPRWPQKLKKAGFKKLEALFGELEAFIGNFRIEQYFEFFPYCAFFKFFYFKKPGSRSASGFHESVSATPLLIVITYDVPLFYSFLTCINKNAFLPTIGTP
jgi:hypothetical protein